MNTKKEILVSLVLPCYNTMKSIERTLVSLEYQTFKDFEVIVINDGSVDYIDCFMKAYQKKTELNLRYFVEPNFGASIARNVGIEIALGKYILFLKGEEILHRQLLELMVQTIELQNTDTVFVNISRDVDAILANDRLSWFTTHFMDSKELMDEFMFNKSNIMFTSFLFKKSIINQYKIRFWPNAGYGEDIEFTWKYLMHCMNGVFIPEIHYGYYRNLESVSNKVSWKKTGLIESVMRVKQLMEKNEYYYTQKFSNYMVPRSIWMIAETYVKGRRKDLFMRMQKYYPIKHNMKKLAKYDLDKLVKISSIMYCIHPNIFYYLIAIIHRR